MVFPKSKIFICIMTYFIIFKTDNVTQILMDFVIINYIDINSQSSWISSLLKITLLFFFSPKFFIWGFANFFRLHGGLIIIKKLISQVSNFKKFFHFKVLKKQIQRQYFSSRFFNYWVFYRIFLVTKASFNTFCDLFVMSNALIYFLKYWKKVKPSFNFDFDGFLH